MLIVALFWSCVLLLAVNLTALSVHRRVVATSLGGLGVSIFGASGFFLPPVVVQAALLSVLGLIWQWTRRGPRRFLVLSCGATLLAYGVIGLSVIDTQREYARLRAKYPFESMEDRVPFLPSSSGTKVTVPRLDGLEASISQSGRSYPLKRLHEESISLFIDSPGFGVARMRIRPNEDLLENGLRDQPPPHQLIGPTEVGLVCTTFWARDQPPPHQLIGPAPTPPVSPQSSGEPSEPTDTKPLNELHFEGVLDFVHPNGFGFVKDRKHVAGFQSHGFSEVPNASAKWEVARLELVSLLLHQEPVVYLSERLPSMAEVRGVPTRPLDRFETDGLAALRKGEDLHIEGTRMVGSIRGTKQCLECHGGSRGELLGAFSYVLRLAGE